MSTLAEFLLARIAEDEEAAHREDVDFANTTLLPTYDSDHQERWNTARVLAECEAKRRIVDLCVKAEDQSKPSGSPTLWGQQARLGLWIALRLLALPCASHENYCEEWKP